MPVQNRLHWLTQPGQEEQPVPVQPVGQPVVQRGVHARIEQKDLQLAAGRGVAALIGGQQTAQTGDCVLP